MPPQMHIILITREDPRLPLARLRVRNQLTEVRASDLRFTLAEAADFLGQVMELKLSSENIALIESRTEGWIAGLQLAALSMQGHHDPDSFIKSFTGNHRYIVDFLVDEVLQQQPLSIQTFLLSTSILDRLCGPLCDAVLGNEAREQHAPSTSGQEMLEYLERANLFVVPLDNEKRWYRYHHLFAELLRNRLSRDIHLNLAADVRGVPDLYIRASMWHEDNGLEMEAFQYAAAAKDTDRAARLMEGKGMPLLFRGAAAPVMKWLDSLQDKEFNARPSLWVMYASALLLSGQMNGVEQKLHAVETAVIELEQDSVTKDLIGHIACIRATLAVSNHQADKIIAESLRALEYLHPDNLPVRTSTVWSMGYAYQLQGNRAAAGKAYAEALSLSQNIGHVMITIMSTLGLGNIQEAENLLYMAAETYNRVLKVATDSPMLVTCEANLGLARIHYEWNNLDAAMLYGQRSIQLAKQFENMDRVIAGEIFLAKIRIGRGEGTAAMLDQAEHIARQHHFMNHIPKIAEVQVQLLLQQGHLRLAGHLAKKYKLDFCQARVHLAQGDATSSIAVLQPLGEQMEAKGLKDERLKVLILQAIALDLQAETFEAVQIIIEVLIMAEPGGFIRIFMDEGLPMWKLLCEAANQVKMTTYLNKLLAEFKTEAEKRESNYNQGKAHSNKLLIEPLSERELEVLYLIAQGHSNLEISKKLFIALATVKGHNRMIFDKLQVKRRTEAVARARELGLLSNLQY
ncbi:LuxR C-terminal-related transcriptional regulator [Paenibacillus fonticola]|uniref:LuxR C-terminal-related transcriptional regulator n=1 Tax=Paenibacillus fonticola TaxID=379896 RepID=UPI003083FF50